jgi:hypothetical protein
MPSRTAEIKVKFIRTGGSDPGKEEVIADWRVYDGDQAVAEGSIYEEGAPDSGELIVARICAGTVLAHGLRGVEAGVANLESERPRGEAPRRIQGHFRRLLRSDDRGPEIHVDLEEE